VNEETLVVTASATEQSVKDAPASISVITQQDLQAQTADADAFAVIPFVGELDPGHIAQYVFQVLDRLADVNEETLVVTASATEQSVKDAPASISVITQQDLAGASLTLCSVAEAVTTSVSSFTSARAGNANDTTGCTPHGDLECSG
jgi:outer membrane receptor for ferrienterochelin and colicin